LIYVGGNVQLAELFQKIVAGRAGLYPGGFFFKVPLLLFDPLN
jgi:hypothetical protein